MALQLVLLLKSNEITEDWRLIQTFLHTTTVSHQKLLHARLLSLCYSSHPTAHFATLCSCFTSSHSVLLLLRIFLCPPSCLLASFLPLHLYYPLNNSLCIELCVCSFLFSIPWRCEPWSTGWRQDLFFCARAPSLSLCSAIQELLLLSLLWHRVGLQSS